MSRFVGPPRVQCCRWWPWHIPGGRSHPGAVQWRSRTTSAFHSGAGIVWVARPTSMTCDRPSVTTRVMSQSHVRRSRVARDRCPTCAASRRMSATRSGARSSNSAISTTAVKCGPARRRELPSSPASSARRQMFTDARRHAAGYGARLPRAEVAFHLRIQRGRDQFGALGIERTVEHPHPTERRRQVHAPTLVQLLVGRGTAITVEGIGEPRARPYATHAAGPGERSRPGALRPRRSCASDPAVHTSVITLAC